MIRASRARATNRRRKRILRLQKSYPSFGASVKISVSKKEPQRCFVEVLDESASPLTTGVLRDGPLRDAGRFFFGEPARDLYAYEGKPQGARMVPGREVRVVHSLGGVQRAGRRGMGNGNPAHQPHRLRKAPELRVLEPSARLEVFLRRRISLLRARRRRTGQHRAKDRRAAHRS